MQLPAPLHQLRLTHLDPEHSSKMHAGCGAKCRTAGSPTPYLIMLEGIALGVCNVHPATGKGTQPAHHELKALLELLPLLCTQLRPYCPATAQG
jgi:hypothetical protein